MQAVVEALTRLGLPPQLRAGERCRQRPVVGRLRLTALKGVRPRCSCDAQSRQGSGLRVDPSRRDAAPRCRRRNPGSTRRESAHSPLRPAGSRISACTASAVTMGRCSRGPAHSRSAGTVQGVGFRPWVYRVARVTGVTGRVRNDAAGVDHRRLRRRRRRCERSTRALHGAAAGRRGSTPSTPSRDRRRSGRQLRHRRTARPAADRRVSIPPDLATCADCLAEIFDPRRSPLPLSVHQLHELRAALHHRHRRSVRPRRRRRWRRSRCAPACRREYDDPPDRRFHAQPNACPVCGPRLDAATPPDGAPHSGRSTSIAAAARALARRAHRRGQRHRRIPSRVRRDVARPPSRGCARASTATRSRSR